MAFLRTTGHVTAIRDSGGNTWTYGYNANGMLTSVTAPGANPDITTYYYENADFTLLTGIAINGTRYSTYLFIVGRHLLSAASYRVALSRRFVEWRELTGMLATP